MSDPSAELSNLLCSERTPTNLKYEALRYILGLSAHEEGLQFIVAHGLYMRTLYNLLADESHHEICQVAHNCFINISAVPYGTMAMIGMLPEFTKYFVERMDDRECLFVEPKCQVLANMSRCQEACEQLVSIFKSSDMFSKLMFHYVFSNLEVKSKYDYLGLLFGNLSSCAEGKKLFISDQHPFIRYILPFTCSESKIRRMGAMILLKNVCFDIGIFKYLLEDMDILPALLLPLAGPEEFDDDEMEKLHIDLQYLGDDKQREADPNLRLILLETLLKLCSTRQSREYLRQKGVYFVLRELHKWETFPPALQVCEDIVEILIRDEEDVGADNLMDLNIPEHLIAKFENLSVSTTNQIPEIII